MRGRNAKFSTMVGGRQYAVEASGTVITFVCERAKHEYKIDFGKKPLARRLSESACRMMASWWSREKGGCIGSCPKCEAAQRRDARKMRMG